MFSDEKAEFSLGFSCRRLSAVAPPASSSSSRNDSKVLSDDEYDTDFLASYSMPSSSPCHRFLVGTSLPSVAGSHDGADGDGYGESITPADGGGGDDTTANRLCLLRYREDSNELDLESAFVHPTGEVWSLACHPTDRTLAVTCGGGLDVGGGGVRFRTKLWRLPESAFEKDHDDDDDYDDMGAASNLGGSFDDGFGSDHRGSNAGRGRKRTESSASAMSAAGGKLETVLSIPHEAVGRDASESSASSEGWNGRVGCVLWNPLLSGGGSGSSNNGVEGRHLITVGWNDDSPIALWDVSDDSSSEAREVWSTGGGGAKFKGGKRTNRENILPRRASWDPHDPNIILFSSGPDVVAHDLRCRPDGNNAGGIGVLRAAHRCGGVADICHDALQPRVVATSGMDGTVKFWDLRMHLSARGEGDDGDDDVFRSGRQRPTATLLRAARGGHSHWCHRVAYNSFHDQLVLSAGTDGVVNLWRMSSCSSAPLLELEDNDEDDEDEDGEDEDEDQAGEDNINNDENDDGGREDEEASTSSPKSTAMDTPGGGEAKAEKKKESAAPDIRVARHECSDAAADTAWCVSDPWLYAALSCDGDVVVHHVPSKEKYKILL